MVNRTSANFHSHYHFREKCLQRICEWYRESLQRRKAFEKLLPVSLSPLHCTFVSFHPLILTFTTCNPRYCQSWLQCSSGRPVWALFFFFWYLWYVPLHSGVTLFHSPTQGITSLKGVLVDLVGSFNETLVFHSVSDMTCHTVGSKIWQLKTQFLSQSFHITIYQTHAALLYCHIIATSRKLPWCGSVPEVNSSWH